MAKAPEAPNLDLPVEPIQRLTKPLREFLHIESVSGLLLLACAVLALAVANSPWAESWQAFWDTHLIVGFGSFRLDYPLWYWVNDGLMTIFFFVIGLEVKRELTTGELRDPRARVLPAAAAIGGAIVPAAIYAAVHFGGPAQNGWAVPMATDIAFVVGFLALFGARVPPAIKVFLLSLAIVDDLLAVAVVAVFFTAELHVALLLAGLGGLLLTALLRLLGVRSIGIYVLVGAVTWLLALKGGVHPTAAGVILGLMTPAKSWVGKGRLDRILEATRRHLPGARRAERAVLLDRTRTAVTEAVPPLERLEHALHPWVAYAIMPVFALANAGLPLSWEEVVDPISLAVAAGLVIGKPVGIAGFAYLAIRLGWARMPEGMSVGVLLGGAALCGVGFTMALFLASLGLQPPHLDYAKMGVMVGSALSAVIGMTLLSRVLPKRQEQAGPSAPRA